MSVLRGKANVLLTIFTGALVIVAFLQWCTLEKTNETQRISTRAFVYVRDFKRAGYPTKIHGQFAITVSVVNVGSTAARHVRARFDCLNPRNDKVEQAYDEWFATVGRVVPPMVIAPGQLLQLQACEFTSDAVRRARTQGYAAIVVGEIRYADTFNVNAVRMTQITQRINFDDRYDIDGGHSFSYIGRHNCADSDCPDYEDMKATKPW